MNLMYTNLKYSNFQKKKHYNQLQKRMGLSSFPTPNIQGLMTKPYFQIPITI